MVVECWTWVQEVPSSNPGGAKMLKCIIFKYLPLLS